MSKITGGSAFGIGDAEIDPQDAVLLDGCTVAIVGTADPTGAGRAVAMNLEGRINKSTARSDVLYLMDLDGAAIVISELLGLIGRSGPNALDALMERIHALPQ